VRPLRVELEGFGSFRDPTVVDLADTELFVLSGATGSGKTTVVEAIVFACYGSVPRYDDRRLVAPVINQGRNEARVRLTFTADDRTYQATRVVRRTKQGATTKEARLEDVTGGGGRTLAGNADELTTAVVGLIGLSFEQFTRSVVLPQGAFDRFLFAKPADRADLLVQLLDLGVYEDVGKRARILATAADARAGELRRQLEGELAGATAAARDQAVAQVDRLTRLGTRCDELQPELDAAVEAGREARQRAEQATADVDALAGLRRPEGVDDLAARLAAATEARSAAEAALQAASAGAEQAEDRLAALPRADQLAELQRLGEERRTLDADRRGRADRQQQAAAALEEATGRVLAAETGVAEARTALDAARREELAHTLAAGLQPGDPCPVCVRPVDDVPDHGDATATVAAERELAARERELTAAREARNDADRALATDAQALAGLDDRLAALTLRRDELLTAVGIATDDHDAVGRLVAEQAAAQTAATEARTVERTARTRVRETLAASETLRTEAEGAWTTFDAARDRVARLGPPPVDRADLGGSWTALLAWATDRRPTAEQDAAAAHAAVEAAKQRWRELDRALRDECHGAGVEVPPSTQTSVAVATAAEGARQRLKRLEEQLARAGEARRALAEAAEERTLAKALGDHLRADGFERWLLSRALRLLVHGASSILRELSSGAYSLALDDASQFLVLDHRNADEPRTVRSLSGGERFLASLALALALSEHVAELAAEGAARLESLFLDEGFGTLDADTLDVVASAIEELGSRGRMVGVITHVRDLAERIPTRFEVRRGPTGSTVRRVDVGATEDAAPTDDDAPGGRGPGEVPGPATDEEDAA
jgi:DNA repair protein SbcC/Rad50